MSEAVNERAWLSLSDAISGVPAEQQLVYLAKLSLLLAERLDDADAFAELCEQAARHLGGDEQAGRHLGGEG